MPLAGALVQIRSEDDLGGHHLSARTDVDGTYRLSHIPSGRYKIYAQRANDASNPFLGALDQKNTQETIVVDEGQTYTKIFTITN